MAFYEMLPGAGMPSGLQAGMDSVLNKKFGTSTTYPAEGWPDNVNLLGPLPEKTVSGAIVSFPDGADGVPLKKCENTLPASLDGYSSVDVNHTGQNLFDKTAVVDDTWIVVNDTTTESTVGYRTSGYIPVKANTKYFVTGKSSNRSAYYDQNKNGIAYFSFSGGASFTCLYDGYIRITIKNDIDLDTFIVNEGNEAITYEPFGDTHTAQLGRTIYGGSADVVAGQGEAQYDITSLDDKLYNYASNIERFDVAISGMESYGYRDDIILPTGYTLSHVLITNAANAPDMTGCVYAGKLYLKNLSCTTRAELQTALSGESLVFPLATPETFTFDPVPIDSKLGNNTMWSEQGDTEVTYRADIALALGE